MSASVVGSTISGWLAVDSDVAVAVEDTQAESNMYITNK
jgi:hypothetical protein